MNTSTLFSNIGILVGANPSPASWAAGNQMKNCSELKDAWLYIEGDEVVSFGKMSDLETKKASFRDNTDVVDLEGRSVLPAWCDSHTHIVFPVSREEEFVDRIHGLTYVEIAERGGGILNSAKKMQAAREDDLFEGATKRIEEIIGFGTGAVEIKSGYGLSFESELKMLRVIKRLKQWSPIPIKSTFLGAHAFPAEFKNNRSEYVNLITEKMIPAIAEEELADYNDVFCDKGFFTVEETDKILEAGVKHGMTPKIHANELDN